MSIITEKQIIQPYINKFHVMEKTIEELGSNSETRENPYTDQEVDPDWLNYFGGYAEKASTKVDQETAEVFAETVKLRFNNGECILRPKSSYQEDLLNRLRLLEQVGLLDQISPNSGLNWTSGAVASKGFSVVVEGGILEWFAGLQCMHAEHRHLFSA